MTPDSTTTFFVRTPRQGQGGDYLVTTLEPVQSSRESLGKRRSLFAPLMESPFTILNSV